MKIKPLYDRVVIKPVEKESKTKSGIIIPETAREKSHQGEVIACGEGRLEDGKIHPLTVKVGDKILYKEYSGDEFKFEGETLIVLKEEDILGIIE